VGIGQFDVTYSSSTGFGGGFGILDAIKEHWGRVESDAVSMGRARDSDNPYKPSSAIVPALANAAAQQAQAALLGQGAGVNEPPVPQSVPETFAATGPGKLEPLIQEGTQTMSLDLGNLLGTLGSSYIQARYGGPRQPQVMSPTIRAQGPRAGVAAQPVLLGTLPEMAGDVYDYFFTDEQKQSLSQMPNAGKVQIDPRTGRVSVCRNRKRRKRLATTSDIKDLAALKSVLSPADLKTWIATHPS